MADAKLKSAQELAELGLYEYSPVPSESFSPYAPQGTEVRALAEGEEFVFHTPETLYGDCLPLRAGPGTTIHLGPTVGGWRIWGFVTPEGVCHHLTAT